MVWIFQECIDPFGGCIRQYIDAGLSFAISLIGILACYKTYSRQREFTFQMIPLSINIITTLFVFCLQISTQQYFNTHLIFMFVQLYSYYLMTYALVFLYLKASLLIKHKTIKKLNIGFITGSVLIVMVAIFVTVLSYTDVIKCTSQYWIFTLVLLCSEVPIYVATIFFGVKIKNKIKSMNKKYQRPDQATMHLFNQEDSYINLKILQTNLFVFTFSITILLHIAEVVLFKFMQNESICLPQTNQIVVRNEIQLTLMIVNNVSEIFPHLMIPLIFWLIPYKINRRAPVSLYITPKMINNRTDSNYRIDDDEVQIHKKLIY